MKQLLTFFLCILASMLYSQKYDYVWMAGAYLPSDSSSTDFTLDFITFPPLIEKLEDSLEMNYENITISNFEGVLQFYSNGCIIRTKTRTLMENGGFINQGPGNTVWDGNCGYLGLGHYPVLQGLFALPFENGVQEIFHAQFEPMPVPYSCTNIAFLTTRLDMKANQGLGKVVFKDSVLVQGCLQTACADRHANGRDWWVLLPDNINNRFYRFLSTPDGLQGPWIQEIENPTIDTFYFGGWNEFSSNGEHLLINDIHSGTAIYDFDRCTGLLSNLRFIPAEPDTYGYGYAAAFSPNSRLIYVVRDNFRKIEQFDLQAADLSASRTKIATWDGYFDYFEPNGPFLETNFWYFQHGPDGKLYNWAGGSKYMHIMDFPDRKGLDCMFRQRAIKLPYYNLGAGAYYPNYRLGPIDGSSCDTLGINNLPQALFRYDLEDTLSPLQVTFTDVSSYEPTNWHWNFGDGVMSQDTNPVHDYTLPGTYNVCLIVSNVYAADTFCQQVMVGTTGIHELPALPYVRVMPNPFTDEIQIELPALVGVQPRFMLFDLYGRNISNLSLHDFDTRLSLPGLPVGIYFWRLLWNGMQTQSGKLVKQ
jgi:PKD domain